MATKLDQKFANNVLDGVKAFKLEIERLEDYCEQLEQKLAVAEDSLNKISSYGAVAQSKDSKKDQDSWFRHCGVQAFQIAREALAKIRGEG